MHKFNKNNNRLVYIMDILHKNMMIVCKTAFPGDNSQVREIPRLLIRSTRSGRQAAARRPARALPYPFTHAQTRPAARARDSHTPPRVCPRMSLSRAQWLPSTRRCRPGYLVGCGERWLRCDVRRGVFGDGDAIRWWFGGLSSFVNGLVWVGKDRI